MKIIVPATSANIGPGFDSVGLAVSRYLVIEVFSKAPEWFVEHDLGNDVPSDTGNLLLRTALSVAPDLPSHQLKMTSDIPLARGLGSSSSVIVAGIELANQLGNLSLSSAEKLRLATEFEGHPDNVAPALLGNLVISSFTEGNLETVVSDFPECDLVAFIPDYELKTSDSRQVLPTELAYGEAVAASSIANLAVAALLKGNLTQAGRLIEADRFHQPYRQALVKEYDSIKDVGKVFGAFATYLSGAGPTIMTLLPKGQGQDFVKHLEGLNLSGTIAPLAVDKEGVQVIK